MLIICPLKSDAFWFFWWSQPVIQTPVEMNTVGDITENGATYYKYADGSTRIVRWHKGGYTTEDHSAWENWRNDNRRNDNNSSRDWELTFQCVFWCVVIPLAFVFLLSRIPKKILLGILLLVIATTVVTLTGIWINNVCETREREKLTYRLSNCSEGVQIEQVRKDPSLIQYITNPSEKVQVAAVIWHLRGIKYVKNPCEKAQLEALKWSRQNICNIKNPCKKIMLLQDQKQLVEKQRQELEIRKKDWYYQSHYSNWIERQQKLLEIEEKKLEEMWRKCLTYH